MIPSVSADPAAVVDVLARTPQILLPLLGEIPASRLKLRLAPGRWSAYENACHLVSFETMFETRLDQMLREDNPELASYTMDPADQDGALLEVDLDKALTSFLSTRPVLVEKLRSLSPEDWARPGRHALFPVMNAHILFRHLALHDMIHTYRIEETLWKQES